MDDAGYRIIEGILNPEECDRLVDKLIPDSALRVAGIRNLMSDPAVQETARDSRLIDIASAFSGKRMIPFKATLFAKTGKANWLVAWHQDTALPLQKALDIEGWGPVSKKEGVTFVHAPTQAFANIVALRIHLDASTKSNGPLRVIPGSHRKRILDDAEFAQWSRKPSVDCLVGKGGVIAMSPLIIHASSKCTSDEPRRVLHIEYADSLDLGDGVSLASA